jgi:hypothetical protein
MSTRPHIVSFAEVDETWLHVTDGLACTSMFIGPTNDPSAPSFEIVKADQEVGDKIAGSRTHGSPCLVIVIEGTIQFDGRWMAVGDLALVPPGVAHGDTVVGPIGAVFAIMFAQRSGMIPQFVDPGDQTRFDTIYRPDVEAVASGAAEQPVVLLPHRDTYTPRRGAAITDPEEVARLMAASSRR